MYAKPYLETVEESRLDFGSMGALPPGVPEQLAVLFDQAVKDSDAVIVNQQIRSGLYGAELIERIAGTVANNPETVFVTDTRDLGPVFPGACLKLNCREATAFVGQEPRDVLADDAAVTLASEITHSTGKPVVLLTRGAHGIVVASDDAVVHVLPVDTGPDVDPVGAGDVATAAMTRCSVQVATRGRLATWPTWQPRSRCVSWVLQGPRTYRPRRCLRRARTTSSTHPDSRTTRPERRLSRARNLRSSSRPR